MRTSALMLRGLFLMQTFAYASWGGGEEGGGWAFVRGSNPDAELRNSLQGANNELVPVDWTLCLAALFGEEDFSHDGEQDEADEIDAFSPPPPPPPLPPIGRSGGRILLPGEGGIQIDESALNLAWENLKAMEDSSFNGDNARQKEVLSEAEMSPMVRLQRELERRALQMQGRANEVNNAIQGLELILAEPKSQVAMTSLAREIQSLNKDQGVDDYPNIQRLLSAIKDQAKERPDSDVARRIRLARQQRLEKAASSLQGEIILSDELAEDRGDWMALEVPERTPEDIALDMVIGNYWLEVVRVLQQIQVTENWLNTMDDVNGNDILAHFQVDFLEVELESNKKKFNRISKQVGQKNDELRRSLDELRKLYFDHLEWLNEHSFDRVIDVLEKILLPQLQQSLARGPGYKAIRSFYEQAANDLKSLSLRKAFESAGHGEDIIQEALADNHFLLQSMILPPREVIITEGVDPKSAAGEAEVKKEASPVAASNDNSYLSYLTFWWSGKPAAQ